MLTECHLSDSLYFHLTCQQVSISFLIIQAPVYHFISHFQYFSFVLPWKASAGKLHFAYHKQPLSCYVVVCHLLKSLPLIHHYYLVSLAGKWRNTRKAEGNWLILNDEIRCKSNVYLMPVQELLGNEKPISVS